MVKEPPAKAGNLRDSSSTPGWEDHLEEEMATQSSILAWKIPWAEEPGGSSSRGLSLRKRTQGREYLNSLSIIFISEKLYHFS